VRPYPGSKNGHFSPNLASSGTLYQGDYQPLCTASLFPSLLRSCPLLRRCGSQSAARRPSSQKMSSIFRSLFACCMSSATPQTTDPERRNVRPVSIARPSRAAPLSCDLRHSDVITGNGYSPDEKREPVTFVEPQVPPPAYSPASSRPSSVVSIPSTRMTMSASMHTGGTIRGSYERSVMTDVTGEFESPPPSYSERGEYGRAASGHEGRLVRRACASCIQGCGNFARKV